VSSSPLAIQQVHRRFPPPDGIAVVSPSRPEPVASLDNPAVGLQQSTTMGGGSGPPSWKHDGGASVARSSGPRPSLSPTPGTPPLPRPAVRHNVVVRSPPCVRPCRRLSAPLEWTSARS
jgi:hypothetical protein